MKTTHEKYDIIGDIHGHADILRALLGKLGYTERGGVYEHPERRVVFVGDFIDRGPKIRETLQIVRAMTEADTAHAVMGNHELDALGLHTKDGRGGYVRCHTEKNLELHRATLDQLAIPMPEEWTDCLKWMKALPLFLDLGGLRIVHACWDAEQISLLKGGNLLSEEWLYKSTDKATREYWALKVLLKGKEIALPDGCTYTMGDGTVRNEIRSKWWLGGEGHTYHSLCLPECERLTKLPVSAKIAGAGYPASAPPVIVGHYWLPPSVPKPVTSNVACVDYSVAKSGGMMTAYRWDGEQVLDAGKMVSVERGD